MIFRLLIALLACFSLLGAVPLARATESSAARLLAGEDYRYGIDFLVFRNLAEGSLRLVDEGGGRYRAELEGKTLGVAAWLTGDRTQRYVAVMEVAGDGRLRSVSYDSLVLKKKRGRWTERRKSFRFDYPAGRIRFEQRDDGVLRKTGEHVIPAGTVPVDILTGFYNLRLGAYGELSPGAQLQIPTISSKGLTTIEVEVLAGAPAKTADFFRGEGKLLRARVDPEVFNTGEASVYAFFDDLGRPVRGIVEDVLGMGDVYGYLQEPVP